MLMEWHWHDYVAALTAGGAVLIFVGLLIWNGIDDYRHGRIVSTWRKSHD